MSELLCTVEGCERAEDGRGFSRPNGLSRHLRQSHPLHSDAVDDPEEPVEADEVVVDEPDGQVVELTLDTDEREVIDALAFLRGSTPFDVLAELVTHAIAEAADDDVAQLVVLRRRWAS